MCVTGHPIILILISGVYINLLLVASGVRGQVAQQAAIQQFDPPLGKPVLHSLHSSYPIGKVPCNTVKNA